MEQNDDIKKKRIANFQKAYETTKANGVFTRKTRERLLGISGLSGRNRTKIDFWLDVREHVKTALIDLQLFIEMAGEKYVNMTITHESLESIARVLLWHPVVERADPDVNKAEIARLFIKWGFEYLSNMAPDLMTISHEQTRATAVDLAEFLAESFKLPSERFYSRPATQSGYGY